MALLNIPELKEPHICETACDHRDCAAMRQDFITHGKCIECGYEFKAGDKFAYCPDHDNFEETKYNKKCIDCLIKEEET